MRELYKFENIDVFASLEAIMKENTIDLRDDFDIDKRIIQRVAESHSCDKTILWLSRQHGTCCMKERDAFLRHAQNYENWRPSDKHPFDRTLAYIVELTGIQNGEIIGNLFELDFKHYLKHISKCALPVDNLIVTYEYGQRVQSAKEYIGYDLQLGKLECFEAIPNDPKALQSLLQKEKESRDKMKLGNFKKHIATLRTNMIEWEAQHIVEYMKGIRAPNSQDKSHFMAHLSNVFSRIASAKDVGHLLSILPYENPLLCHEDKLGMWIMIDKNEKR